MGRDKAFIDWGGRPLIAQVIERIRPLCSEVMVITSDPLAFAGFGVRVVVDVFPGKGSLGGLYTGLTAARDNFILAVGCDMPFLNVELLRYQISLAAGFDVVIPRATDPSGHSRQTPPEQMRFAKDVNLHPLHSVYAQGCREPIRRALHTGDLRIIRFLDSVYVRVIEPEEVNLYDPAHLSFFNMNTPDDLRVAERLRNDHV